MTHPDFVKGECGHCAGHLEFPADAAGQSVPCPHCGQPTQLTAPMGKAIHSSRRVLILVGSGVLVIGLVLILNLLWPQAKPGRMAKPKPSPTAASPTPVTSHAAPVAPPEPVFQAQTNGFGILAFQLEQTEGSSLVYVTGILRNLTPRQRFGVKLVFALFDTNDQTLGVATDYESLLDPHGEWRFKALVMGSKAASARLQSIAEDK